MLGGWKGDRVRGIKVIGIDVIIFSFFRSYLRVFVIVIDLRYIYFRYRILIIESEGVE